LEVLSKKSISQLAKYHLSEIHSKDIIYSNQKLVEIQGHLLSLEITLNFCSGGHATQGL
jgi:hypothetical protein